LGRCRKQAVWWLVPGPEFFVDPSLSALQGDNFLKIAAQLAMDTPSSIEPACTTQPGDVEKPG
jgi:hypothetical protein